MIARMLFVLLLALAVPAGAQTAIDARAAALRAELAARPATAAEDRRSFLQRQLLASLERRRDLERSRADAGRLVAGDVDVVAGPPHGLIEIDDLRRELQQLDESLAGGERRIALLKQDRAAAAAQLSERVAALRQLDEGGDRQSEAVAIAELEAQLAESATAELDGLIALIGLQQEAARRQRFALGQRLSAVVQPVMVSDQDGTAIEQRLRGRAGQQEARLAAAANERERAHAELTKQDPSASTGQSEILRERLANSDIEIELAREALANLAIEQTAWRMTLRFYRDGDVSALVEARARGPAIRASLMRRQEFLVAMSEQVLGRIGALDAELAQSPADPQADERRALRAVFEQRLQRVQAGILDERHIAALLERLRDDFDQRAGAASWSERLALGLASLRSWVESGWNFELFSVDQTLEVDGRQTTVARGVTVGKLVKAPLILVLGLFAALRFTAWGERWLRRRHRVDEGRARLLRRWSSSLLILICTLSSLLIAGIPLAAFAFIGGAVAIGAGFGTQTLFKNLICGVLVLIERPFRLGDVIEIDGLRGTVVDINLRASVVRDSDGAETLIPNSALVEHKVKNLTFRSRVIRQTLAFTVDPIAEPRAVIDTVEGSVRRHGLVLASHEPVVFLEDFVDHGLRFVLHYWIELKPGIERRRIASDLRLMILKAFDEARIRIAQAHGDTCTGHAALPMTTSDVMA